MNALNIKLSKSYVPAIYSNISTAISNDRLFELRLVNVHSKIPFFLFDAANMNHNFIMISEERCHNVRPTTHYFTSKEVHKCKQRRELYVEKETWKLEFVEYWAEGGVIT